MDKIQQAKYSLPNFHQAILHAKTDQDLIEIMKKYIASVGGFGNAPIEVFQRFKH